MDEQLSEDLVDIDKCLLEAEEALTSKNKKLAEKKIKEARDIIVEAKKRNNIEDSDFEELSEISKRRITEYPSQ